MPINDAVAGYDREQGHVAACYRLQNAYLQAAVELAEAEAKYVRHEIDAAGLKLAVARAETAFAALEKHWKQIDMAAKKQEAKK